MSEDRLVSDVIGELVGRTCETSSIDREAGAVELGIRFREVAAVEKHSTPWTAVDRLMRHVEASQEI